MSKSSPIPPPRRRGPQGIAYAFLFAFALSVGTIIFTGLQVRAPNPERRERLEALQELRTPAPATAEPQVTGERDVTVPPERPLPQGSDAPALPDDAADAADATDATDAASKLPEQSDNGGGEFERLQD
jgi:hypothetical protein